MTRFIHIGDLHLKPGPRNADRLQALDDIISENIDDPQLGAWLFPGDVSDGAMAIADRNALAERFVRMAMKAPLVLVPGNHDRHGELDVFGKLKAHWPIFVVNEPDVLHLTLATGDDAAIFCLPYPERTRFTPRSLSDLFRTHGETLEEARRHGILTAAIFHANIAGSIVATGQPSVPAELDVTADHLQMLGDCYKGGNHIHLAQRIAGAWYAGSICRLNYGEISPKSYIVVDYEETQVAWRHEWTYRVTRRPLNVRPMFHVTGTLSLADGFTYTVTDGIGGETQDQPATWRDCDVRVRVTFAKSETDRLSRDAVYAEFADAEPFTKYEFIAQPDRAVRAPAVAAATTLADKAQAWAALDGRTLPADVLAVLATIQHAVRTGNTDGYLATISDRLDQVEQREEVAA